MTVCPGDSEVDRFDGHCPVCHGDPDRCPTTDPRGLPSSAGMRYSVEPATPPRHEEDTP